MPAAIIIQQRRWFVGARSKEQMPRTSFFCRLDYRTVEWFGVAVGQVTGTKNFLQKKLQLSPFYGKLILQLGLHNQYRLFDWPQECRKTTFHILRIKWWFSMVKWLTNQLSEISRSSQKPVRSGWFASKFGFGSKFRFCQLNDKRIPFEVQSTHRPIKRSETIVLLHN